MISILKSFVPKFFLKPARKSLFALSVAFVLMLCIPVSAVQPPEWTTLYLGHDGQAKCTILTNEEDYVLAGVDSGHFFLGKITSSGQITWWKTYQAGEATCVIQTSDGGYALAGSGDVNFIKTDSSGEMQWSKNYTYDNTTYKTKTFQIMSIIQTHDDGYVLAGKTPSGPVLGWDWTLRTSSNGDVVWGKTYGEKWAHCVAKTVLEVNDGYILAANGKLYKLDENGSVEWSQPAMDLNTDIAKTSDGGFLLCNDVTLAKSDSEGKILWSKSFSVDSAQGCSLHSALQTSDGGFLAYGTAWPKWEGVVWIVKTDTDGNQVESILSEPVLGHNTYIRSMFEAGDKEYVFAGVIEGISRTEGSKVWVGKVYTSSQPQTNNPNPEITNVLTPNPSQTPKQVIVEDDQSTTPIVFVALLITVAAAIVVGSVIYYKRYK
jgi:hypothetical protein